MTRPGHTSTFPAVTTHLHQPGTNTTLIRSIHLLAPCLPHPVRVRDRRRSAGDCASMRTTEIVAATSALTGGGVSIGTVTAAKTALATATPSGSATGGGAETTATTVMTASGGTRSVTGASAGTAAAIVRAATTTTGSPPAGTSAHRASRPRTCSTSRISAWSGSPRRTTCASSSDSCFPFSLSLSPTFSPLDLPRHLPSTRHLARGADASRVPAENPTVSKQASSASGSRRSAASILTSSPPPTPTSTSAASCGAGTTAHSLVLATRLTKARARGRLTTRPSEC